jgi:hypothetical protein
VGQDLACALIYGFLCAVDDVEKRHRSGATVPESALWVANMKSKYFDFLSILSFSSVLSDPYLL